VALFAREGGLKSISALLSHGAAGGALVLRGEAGVGKTARFQSAKTGSRDAKHRSRKSAPIPTTPRRVTGSRRRGWLP
jgi:hypothetical protein